MTDRAVRVGIALGLLLAGCGPSSGQDNSGQTPGDGDGGLVIRPAMADIVVELPGTASQAFQVFQVDEDGDETDVTATATLRLDRAALGSFAAGTLTSTGAATGLGVVTATLDDLHGTAAVTVRVHGERLAEGAPSQAPGWFDFATDDPSLAPVVVYPTDQALVPPNLGDLEVDFTHPAAADLFEVTLASEFIELVVYLPHQAALPATDDWLAFVLAEWRMVVGNAVAPDLTISVRAMTMADPTRAGSASITLHTTRDDLLGGIYYWAAASANGSAYGIYRHDMSRPGEPAESFYTTVETGRCVACHVISRDGSLMAVTYDGGNGPANLINVGDRTQRAPSSNWNFAAFDATGTRMVTAYRGSMGLYDVASGGRVATLSVLGIATQPDISPVGNKLLYVAPTQRSEDYAFTGGSIIIRDFDAASGALGPVGTLVASPMNNYYPSFSPDGAWVLFNTSTGDAYDDGDAQVNVVQSTGGTPQRLEPTAGNTDNSWPRWAPFESIDKAGERVYWYTFSSRRDVGVRLRAVGRPQIWMSAFYPDRAALGQAAGTPPFRLPFQDIGTSNHIAQWTERIIDVVERVSPGR